MELVSGWWICSDPSVMAIQCHGQSESAAQFSYRDVLQKVLVDARLGYKIPFYPFHTIYCSFLYHPHFPMRRRLFPLVYFWKGVFKSP